MDYIGKYILLVFYSNIALQEVIEDIIMLNDYSYKFQLKANCQIIAISPVSLLIIENFLEYLGSARHISI